MKVLFFLIVLVNSLLLGTNSFTVGSIQQHRCLSTPSNRVVQLSSSSSSTETEEDSSSSSSPLATLPPELSKIATAFSRVDNDSLRHKQLLYMANGLPLIDKEKMIPENKVPGCLSTVFIDARAMWNEERQNYLVDFVGESDGLLTKGLVALLVRGLSGSTAEEIEAVDPQFIQDAQIGQSLTPGRNNGFLNMLAVMKKKAREATETAKEGSSIKEEETAASTSTSDVATAAPMYNGIVSALQVLKPTVLELVDNSHQHAGHAGSKGYDGESHFDLYIVADAFDGLNLVKRHKLVYMLLGDIMPKIHALQIKAKTPSEV